MFYNSHQREKYKEHSPFQIYYYYLNKKKNEMDEDKIKG